MKNDGLIGDSHATWNKNDDVDSKSDNNFYYDETGDGGYNHLEIRRIKRLYTEGANRKGDEAEPMKDTRDWIETEVFGRN